MDKLLLDSNILIDWMTDRKPYSDPATELISLIDRKKAIGFVTPLVLSDLSRIMEATSSKKVVNDFLEDIERSFEILEITNKDAANAVKNRYGKFEEELHYEAAKRKGIDFIITRNKKNYPKEKVEIINASEYLDKKRMEDK